MGFLIIVTVFTLGTIYLAMTRPCQSGWHRHRHLRHHFHRHAR